MSSDDSKLIMLQLQTAEGLAIEVEEALASQSQTLKELIDACCATSVIPLPNIHLTEMEKVIKYWWHHAYPKNDESLKEFDKEFLEGLKADQVAFSDLLLVANYLNIKPLLELLTTGIADIFKGTLPEQIRQKLGIKNDFPPEGLIVLQTCEGVTIQVEEAVASQSQTLKELIEAGCATSVIPLPNVHLPAMAKVLEYCHHHTKANNEFLKDFDKEFLEGVKADEGALYDLLLAANYLNIKPLIDLLTTGIADMIKGKLPEQIRLTFGIKNDSPPEGLIVLQTAEGLTIEVEEAVASQSQTLKDLIEAGCVTSVIPLPNVHLSAMVKVLKYCHHHAKPNNDKFLKDFDKEFLEGLKADQRALYDLLLAANYLNIKPLIDLLTTGIADMIKGKSPEQVRQTFGIKNDFPPEVEEEVRKENAYAYD